MDEENRKDDVIAEGILSKSAVIEPGEATEAELKQINKYIPKRVRRNSDDTES